MKKQVLLLHGALGSAAQMQPLALSLSEQFEVSALNFIGHGGVTLPDSGFCVATLVEQTEQWLEAQTKEPVAIFGYSMGGYVALKLAAKRPDLVAKVITLATKLEWNEAMLPRELKMLDANAIELKVPHFAEELRQRFAPVDWKTALKATAEMMTKIVQHDFLSDEEITKLCIPVLLSVGDRDKMVSVEETLTLFRKLPKGSFAVLPNTPHPFEQADIQRLTFMLSDFLNS